MKCHQSIYIACVWLSLFSGSTLAESAVAIPVVLPDVSQPFLEREAKIAPHEYSLAQEIRPLLVQQAYTEVLEILDQYQVEKSPALLLLEAQLKLQNKQWEKAESLLLQAIDRMPHFMRAHLALAGIYQHRQNWAAARQSLSLAISLGAMGANHFAQLGYLNMQMHDPHAAVGAYQQALMLAPDNDDIRQGLLIALLNSEQFNAAGHLLSGMLEQQPNNTDLWVQRANLALQQDKTERALASLEVALRLGDVGTASTVTAMQLNVRQHNYPRATALAVSLIEQQALDYANISKLMTWLSQQNQWTHLNQILSTLLASKANFTAGQLSSLLYFQGKVSHQNGQNKQAKTYWQQAVKKDPLNGEALLALAQLVKAQQEYALAELLFKRAQRIEEQSLNAGLGLAQLYIDTQDYTAALNQLEGIRNQHPNKHALDSNMRVLQNLIDGQSE